MKAILRILLIALILICAIAFLSGSPEPPAVTVKSTEGSAKAVLFGYHWSRGWSHAITDTMHPLEAKDLLPCVTAPDGKVTVSAGRKPDGISAKFWAWDETFTGQNVSGISLPVSDLTAVLPEGDWVVCFHLRWEGKWIHGYADYAVEVRSGG